MTSETLNLVIGLFALTWLVGGLVIYLIQRRPEAAALDAETAARLHALQLQREVVTIYENAYREATAIQRSGVDAALGLLRVIAPLTPWKTDDAARDLLEDVTLPGAPAAPDGGSGGVELPEIDPNALG